MFEFSGMRCQPLRRALYASNQKVDSCDNLISESA
ncbi:acetyltransferase [Vibrio cholerae]|nr:acetyltransferase [Vibrio paracholerae]MBN7283493.1 acetyltransferase [Vibrio paracholerae]MEB5521724.1 acetyltransferase [Vibrio cholerae]